MTLQLLLWFYSNGIWLTITKYIRVWLSKLIYDAAYDVLYSLNTLQIAPSTVILFMEGVHFSYINIFFLWQHAYIFKYLYSVLDWIEKFSLGGGRISAWEQPEKCPNQNTIYRKSHME